MTSKQTKTSTAGATAPNKGAFNLEALISKQDPAAKTQGVTIPVNTLILESTRCYDKAVEIRDRFLRLSSFEIRHLDNLPSLAESLAAAEQEWKLASTTKRATSLAPLRAQGEKLRSDIVADGRYLLRKDPKALLKLDDISHGKSISDVAADLRKLGAFVKSYAKVIFADGSRPSDLAETASALAEKLVHGNDEQAAADAQARRNQIYNLLQEALDEVRGAARYLLRDDPKRLAPMLSRYNAVRRKSARDAKAQGTPAGAKAAPTGEGDAPAGAPANPFKDAGSSAKK